MLKESKATYSSLEDGWVSGQDPIMWKSTVCATQTAQQNPEKIQKGTTELDCRMYFVQDGLRSKV